jgi:hypothetical protein
MEIIFSGRDLAYVLRRPVEVATQSGHKKYYLGRIEKGFDFPGYRFSLEGISPAKKTLQNFIKQCTRLYEQEREEPDGSPRLGLSIKRWLSWIQSGLGIKIAPVFRFSEGCLRALFPDYDSD